MRDRVFLVVDDSAMVRMHIRKLLESIFASATVYAAENGAQALELLKNNPVDVVISDWNMPEMSGEELLYEIRKDEQTNSIPFIMMSSNDSRDFLITAIQLGATQYIVKPFSVNELEEKIRASISMLNRRKERRYAMPRHTAVIEINKKTFQGELVDLSRTGASYSCNKYDAEFSLFKNCTLELTIPDPKEKNKTCMLLGGLSGKIVRLEAKNTFHPTSTEFQAALYFNPVYMKKEVEEKLNKLIKLLASNTPDFIDND